MPRDSRDIEALVRWAVCPVVYPGNLLEGGKDGTVRDDLDELH